MIGLVRSLVTLSIAVSLSLAGKITPKTTKPILLQYNNAAYVSDYTFSFQIETATWPSSTLKIEFPSG
jgi:hypothetical protein